MFTNLKLRNRMLLGYAIPVSLFVALVGPIFTSANKVGESYKQTRISLAAIEGADSMGFHLARMVGDARGYVLIKDNRLIDNYQESLKKFNEVANSLDKASENSLQKERLKKMIALKDEYNIFSNQIISLMNQGKQQEAVKVFTTGKGIKIISEFNQLNQAFNEKEHETLNTVTVKAEDNLHFLIVAVVIGAVLGISISVMAAFLISAGIAQTVSKAVQAIASSSTEIAATVEQQERTATQQSASVNQTTTTMDELGAASRTSAQQAEVAASAALQALSLAADGNKAVEQTLAEMAQLREKVSAIAFQIQQLSEQTLQIGNISSLVTDLANQTNMLALNAAVEAVRAGEHGKGFAVVAAEIRKLADESKTSANKINNLVIDIQQAINSTVMVTDEGSKTVDFGVKITQKTAEAFNGVSLAINNVVVNNQQIALTSQQQAVAIQQVLEAMNSLNQAAQETANGISQTKFGTRQLNEAAQNLQSMV